MKSLAFTALLLLVAGAAMADVQGLWLSEDKDARVEVAPCGDELCGKIVWLEDPNGDDGKPRIDVENPDASQRDRPILGLDILEGFDPDPNRKGLWTGGTVYDPKSGKTYKAQLSMEGNDKMKLRGYVGVSLLGRTSYWTRVAPAQTGSGED